MEHLRVHSDSDPWRLQLRIKRELFNQRIHILLSQKRDSPAPGFSLTGPTPLEQILNLRLALTQNNIAALQDAVNQFVAPSDETLSQVASWLAAHNLASSPISPAGDWISVNMTVSQANELFNPDTNQTVVRTLSYSIPSSLKADISWVHPTVNFPPANVRSAPLNIKSRTVSATPPVGSVSADCRATSSWTPKCLQELYGISSAPAKAAGHVFGVSGFDNGFANKRDLKAFLQTYRPDMNPNTTFDLISVDDGINNQLPAGASFFSVCAASLHSNHIPNWQAPDIQYTVGLATGVPITYISTGTLPNDFFTEMLDQAHHLLSMPNPPQTIFNGYGSLESQVSPQIAISLCNAYAQLAARGVSYIVETGLFGVGCTPFDPPFPATCPFVTAVGATEFTTDETEETASSFSGGGFSDFFKRPKYQDAAIKGYLKSGDIQNTGFNASGRAVPDVSAISQVDFIVVGEVVNFASSTDFSAAIFSSIVAQLNNERIAAGKPGLGLLNPLLYQNPSAFNDFTVGSNPGCGEIGFNATRGWDPVTGFGSPIYPKLQEICKKL
ncbi:peptidase S8/S53 domain-containing protein [Mycena vulgaris]|nr:peptidase S8/S53 domain-containing protein [Mycena vulgaris]